PRSPRTAPPPGPTAPRAAATARSASARSPRATSAMTRSSIGETSTKVSDEPTRSPRIQCSVETSTPPISGVPPVDNLPVAFRQQVVRYRTLGRCRSASQTPSHPPPQGEATYVAEPGGAPCRAGLRHERRPLGDLPARRAPV